MGRMDREEKDQRRGDGGNATDIGIVWSASNFFKLDCRF